MMSGLERSSSLAVSPFSCPSTRSCRQSLRQQGRDTPLSVRGSVPPGAVFVSQHGKRCSSRREPLPLLSAGALVKRLPFVSCHSVEGTPCTDPTLDAPPTFLSNRASLATAKTHVHRSRAGFMSCLVLFCFLIHGSAPGLLLPFLLFFFLAFSGCGLKRRLSICCEGQRKVSWREAPSAGRTGCLRQERLLVRLNHPVTAAT